MPANYAHYRFGKQVLPNLPADVRQCIQRFRRMYDTGLQGPDILFYHNIFGKSAVYDLGDSFHRQSGKEFFSGVCAQADSEAAKAYLYGLLAHYCLDSQCHPFVNRIVSIGEAGHISLESEFERVLLQKDGVQIPYSYDRSRHIRPTRGECMTVSGFYPPVTGGTVSRCIKGMAFSLRFLSGSSREKTEKWMKRFTPNHMDQLIPVEENPEYVYMIGELLELYDQALARYPLLLQQLRQHMEDGTELSDAFAPDFG